MGGSSAAGFDRCTGELMPRKLDLGLQAQPKPALAEPRPVPQKASQQPWSRRRKGDSSLKARGGTMAGPVQLQHAGSGLRRRRALAVFHRLHGHVPQDELRSARLRSVHRIGFPPSPCVGRAIANVLPRPPTAEWVLRFYQADQIDFVTLRSRPGLFRGFLWYRPGLCQCRFW
jgi:hypothetical protein